MQLYFLVNQATSKPEVRAAFYGNGKVTAAAASPYAHIRPQVRDSRDGSLRLVELGCEPGDVAGLMDGAAALDVEITVFGSAPDYEDSQQACLEYLAANRADWEAE